MVESECVLSCSRELQLSVSTLPWLDTLTVVVIGNSVGKKDRGMCRNWQWDATGWY